MTVQAWLARACSQGVPPPELRAQGQIIIRDICSVAVAGQRSQAARIMRDYIPKVPSGEPVPVWGTNIWTDPASAALVNATAAQALDYDDWSPDCASHLGGVMVPALAAVTPLVKDPTRQVDGLTKGLQVAGALAGPHFQNLYDRGLQPTHFIGTLGAVAAMVYALDLCVAKAENAFGLVATQLLGLRAHTGTSYKGAQGGVASAAAVRSVLLAMGGLQAGAGAVDSILALVGLEDVTVRSFVGRDLGEPAIVATKAFPTCGAAHTAIEGALALRSRCPGDAITSSDIRVLSPRGVHDALVFRDPKTPDEARFSLTYSVAVAWVHGQVTLDDFEPAALDRPEVRAVMDRITTSIEDELAPPAGWSGYPAIVSISGGYYDDEVRVDVPVGYPTRPLSEEQLRSKFLKCIRMTVDEKTSLTAFDDLNTADVFRMAQRVFALRS
jgi:2-methylcitrate dehydratase PrpD